jgi:hypothetical protein
VGWKTINGRPYLYRSLRDGGRVRSEYCGGGTTAFLIAQMNAIEREDRTSKREEERERRKQEQEILDALDNLVVRPGERRLRF